MAACVAKYDGSLIIMASAQDPGDLLYMNQIIPLLGERVRAAVQAGVSPAKISVDPGIGKWIPEKTAIHDLALLDNFRRLRLLERPVVAALSRKSFIGARLGLPDPQQRLPGTLAATAIAVYLGAHIVRTHDISASRDTVAMAQAIRGRPARVDDEDLDWMWRSWDIWARERIWPRYCGELRWTSGDLECSPRKDPFAS